MATFDTVQDYVTEARTMLQDLVNAGGNIGPYRFSDVQLVNYLNIAMLEAYRVRADLFLGSNMKFSVPFFSATTMTAPVPMEMGFRPAFTAYMAGRAQATDEEETSDARAKDLLTTFKGQLLVTTS